MKLLLLLFFLFISCKKQSNSLQGQYLLRCSVYQLERDRPYYLEVMEEADISFYGIVLLGKKDPNIREYLLSNRSGELWEYQKGYSYSPVDASWVVEALINYGNSRDNELIKSSLDLMTKYGFEKQTGAIIGMSTGFTPYFIGTDLDATSHLSYLLGNYDKNKFKAILEQTNKYILNQQSSSGLWTSKWYASTLLSSFLSLRALMLFPNENQKNIGKAIDGITNLQAPNGSFLNSVLETSLAILALKHVKCCEDKVQKAKNWLKQQKNIPMSPFLFYWLEIEGQKKFFDCWDKGKITEAFRDWALK